MKIYKSLLVAILCTVFAGAQSTDSTKSDPNQELTSHLEQLIEEGYVRIPKEDFDSIINNRISTSINDRFNSLLTFLALLIGILSGLSFFQSYRSRKDIKEQVMAELNSQIETRNRDLREFFEELITSRLKEIEKNTNEKLEIGNKMNVENIKKVESQLEQTRSQIERSEDFLLNIEYKDLSKQVFDRTYNYELTHERLNELLQGAQAKRKEKMVPEIINLLTYIYYEHREYNEMTKLISAYESDYRLVSTSYINAALTAIFDYHHYNSKAQRDKALEYLDKALDLMRGYGQAYALKLQIYMTDYLRADDDDSKRKANDNARKILMEILKAESDFPAKETIDRIRIDAQSESYKKYIDILYELFPAELDEMNKRYIKFNEEFNQLD